MSDNIELTSQEYEDLKDDIKWRTSTSIYLKSLTKTLDDHIKSSQTFRDNVRSLKIHRVMQWFFLSGIIIVLLFRK